MTVELRESHLKVISTVLTNIGSGLVLLPFTVRDPVVLTMSLIIAILAFRLAVKVEDILKEL